MPPRKLSLPIVEEILGTKPTLANARRRLGGRGTTTAAAGAIVLVGAKKPGVILFASGADVDVVLEGGLVRRTTAKECVGHVGDVSNELRAVAKDALIFASLREGEAVVYEPAAGRSAQGTLIEKCRYGALVAAPDGRILAVGFRKLWPVATGTTC